MQRGYKSELAGLKDCRLGISKKILL